jgi:hypothetical protein
MQVFVLSFLLFFASVGGVFARGNYPTDTDVGVPTKSEIQKVLLEGQDIAKLLGDDELNVWSKDDNTPLLDKFRKMAAAGFVGKFSVEVRLVGFKGGELGSGQPEKDLVTPELLTKHLDTLPGPGGERLHVLRPDGRHISGNDLDISNTILFTVVNADNDYYSAKKSLESTVNEVIHENVVKGGRSFLPVDVMDEIIAKDFDSTPSHASYVLYFLNPKLPPPSTDPEDGHVTRTPVYWYVQDAKKNVYHPCGIVSWAGRKRYAWIDISAGPAHYGPRSVGEGGIFEDSLPRASDAKSGLAAKLAAVTWRTAQHLFFPPMNHFPVFFTPKLQVNLVYISDATVDSENDQSGQYWAKAMEAIKRTGKFGQDVDIQYSHISLENCPLCLTALSNSLKSHTSTSVGLTMETHVHQYIDSKEMAYWLGKFGEEYWGLKDQSHHNAAERTVPVYVFDLKQTRDDILLFDRLHQSVFLEGMVVSVESEPEKALLNYVCSGNALMMNPRDSRQATFASVLKGAWGITDTRERWEPLRKAIKMDYLWAASNSPLGPFAQSFNTSFSQNDAASRNFIYSQVAATMARLHMAFDDMVRFKTNPRDALSWEGYGALRSRWNMLEYKLHRASKYLSTHDFLHSLFFVHSTRADVTEITALLNKAHGKVKVEMECTGQYTLNEVLSLNMGKFWLWSGGISILWFGYNARRLWKRHWENMMNDEKAMNGDDGFLKPMKRMEFRFA